jgi:hypothetical protein
MTTDALAGLPAWIVQAARSMVAVLFIYED